MIFRSMLTVALIASLPAAAQVLTPDHHTCANVRGDVQPPEQERACSAVIKLGGDKENLATAHSNRGNSFLRREDYDKAIRDYDQAISLNPGFADAYRNRGAANFNTGQYEKSVADYDAVIRLDPREPSGYTDRCSARVAMGKPQEAMPDCERALDLDPAYDEARGWRALIHLQLGNVALAEEDITLILKDQPNESSFVYVWAMVLEAKGEKALAEAQFQRSRELDRAEFARMEQVAGRFRRR